ncbi:YqaE/Pmp3 family membrane protein [Halomonas sp. V046]|uniref:YqaE/Pmp3 family membrane protein n=1 Tax=Halomonas sp. V046 TaxID=3459611 RepID=UPI004044B141
MDAREYLARKGLDGERDKEKPNTLEEKAWDRARGSHDHRPKSGTPHDWEDWERYHDLLADGADQLQQKINVEAHREALSHAERGAGSGSGGVATAAGGSAKAPAAPKGGVEHFTPAAGDRARHDVDHGSASASASASASRAEPAPQRLATPGLRLALMLLVLCLPPLAVALTDGGPRRIAIAFLLMLAGWVPGVIYAAWWLRQSDY